MVFVWKIYCNYLKAALLCAGENLWGILEISGTYATAEYNKLFAERTSNTSR